MKTFDLRKIKRALGHGDIQKVADAAGVAARVVTETLSRGWHPDLRNDIVGAALDILRGKGDNPELVKEAESMKFTSDLYSGVYRKPRNKFQKGNKFGGRRSRKPNLILIGAAGIVAVLLLFRKRLFANNQ